GGQDHFPTLLDRVAQIERGVDQRLAELSHPWGVLSERLQGLEQAVLDSRNGKSGELAMLADRLKGIEIASRNIDLGPIASRLDIIEEAVLS
ncbi:hypothetical protein ACSTI6_23745, partial [Vibrio parahaemolyticus]